MQNLSMIYWVSPSHQKETKSISSLPFFIHCEANEGGLGAVLDQKQNNKMKVVMHHVQLSQPKRIVSYVVAN